jgi:hypothetical protein
VAARSSPNSNGAHTSIAIVDLTLWHGHEGCRFALLSGGARAAAGRGGPLA